VFELVGGQPARLWRFVSPGIESFRHQMGVLAYVSDRLRIGPLNLETGLRYDAVSGAAEGAETGIEWASLLPRVALDLTAARFSIFTGLLRSAYQLPLDWLAVGDPAAPTADVFRWETSTAATISPLIARAGPGTGGRPGFAGIDSNLERPSTDEFVLGFEIRPTPTTRLRLTGMNRRERNIVGTVNTAMPPYDAGGVFDPGGNVGSPDDDRIVPFYSRQPAGFGRDRYLLTNLGLDDATFKGLELTASLNRDRMTLFFGATAGRAEIFGANRGFGPLENDQGVLGELGIDPNAAVFARGRPFSDRGYTAKLLGIYRFPSATTLGVIARYQDGQPFSRMLLRPELAQGPDAVRAFASGDSRFMFVGTLDARLQQGLPLGGGGLDLVLDAYNLLNLSNSVEELTTEAPDVRIGRVVQPPRSVHIGVRITF
jgi:hypothetical protein